VTPAKVNAIRGEFMRQCDALDGRTDGVINNYMACRARFDETAGDPWVAKRCPGGVDPNPVETSAAACLTDGQISTLRLVYGRYRYASPLANGDRTFGMWVPNTDPSGSGLIVSARFRGQEGAAPDAPMHSHLGVLGVTGFLMRRPADANPLDYVEGGPWNRRREQLSAWLDATNPDLTSFRQRGGKMIVAIGTNDTLASPGEQLDYYQSLVETMGQATLDSFARLYVLPQTGHGLAGTSYGIDGDGQPVTPAPIPAGFDRLTLLIDWVERQVPPGRAIVGTADGRTLPICSYPEYPRYVSGSPGVAASYACAR
jgi:feruloyl esterase